MKKSSILSVSHPKLAKEWHPTKNGELTPSMVTFGSSKKVWWQCEKGHEWESIVNSRSRGTGCPYCSGQKDAVVSANPELAKAWLSTKDDDLMPEIW